MPVGRVPDEGPLSARIAVVGEAPGQDEMYYKRPFVGASGKLQDQWITAAGLRRRDVYITNVLDTRPPGNGNIENADDEDIWASVTELHKRLDRLPNLQVVAAVGTYASYALTGHGKVKWLSTKEKRAVPGITSCRGYYYQYTTLSGRCVTVIPMLHPASLMRSNMLMEVACLSDWKRVAQCLRDPWPVPTRTHIIDPTEAEVESFTRMVEEWREDLVLATDVETWGNQLNCVGFSHHPEWSITVPLEYAKQRETFFPYIRRLLANPALKALQNGVFDGFWFKRSPSIDVFIPDHNWLYDTLFMHHSLFPYEPHSLEYLVSRYVPAQFWKDETKGQGIKQYIASLDTKEAQMRLHLYNGKDCCMTRALVDPLVELLHQYGMYDFYVKHYAEMFAPMLSASTIGVRVDRALMENRQKELLEECQVIREACDDLTGVSLFANKDFSPVKLADFFYRQHKCSKIFSRKASGKSSISLDGTALRRLSMKYPGVVEDVAKLVLRYRQHAKQASFLNPELVDSDDRMRCTYTLNTTAGRAASSGNPMDTGLNLQNQQKDIRNIYLPDRDDWYMLKVDLSTAENRIVDAYIALGLKELGREEECQFYIDRANRKPWEWDQHRARAAALFGVEESQVTKIMRNDGKMVVHACYDNQTDLLTKRGFIPFDQLTEFDEVAEWNSQNFNIDFVVPDDRQVYEYTGDMYRWRNDQVSCLVTPDHGMPILSHANTVCCKVPAGHLVGVAGDLQFPLSGFYSGCANLSESRVRLLVALQADGSIHPERLGQVSWHLKKERKIARLFWLLRQAGIKSSETVSKDDSVTIRVSKKDLADVLYFLPNKCFGPSLLALTASCLDTFLSELKYWDGAVARKDTRYSSKNKDQTDWVQIIAHLRGMRCSVIEQKESGYGIVTYEAAFRPQISTPKPRAHVYHYSGKVYCVTVPSGFIVTRRNGVVSIGGNCQRDMKAQTLSDRFLKHGVVKDEKECAELIDAYHRSDPYIKGVYFKWIQQQLIHKRMLVNPFGRRLDFGTMRMTNDTFRKGYSFPPQSSIADHENTRVWRPTYLYCKQNFGELVRLQVHDEIVVTCSKEMLWPIARFIVTQCDIPIRIGDWDIVVPGEVTVSRTWQGGVEFKKFPSTPEEFYAEIDKL